MTNNRPEEFESKEKSVDNLADAALANIYNEINSDRSRAQTSPSDISNLPKMTIEDSNKSDIGNKVPSLSNLLRNPQQIEKSQTPSQSDALNKSPNKKEHIDSRSHSVDKNAPIQNRIKETLTNPSSTDQSSETKKPQRKPETNPADVSAKDSGSHPNQKPKGSEMPMPSKIENQAEEKGLGLNNHIEAGKISQKPETKKSPESGSDILNQKSDTLPKLTIEDKSNSTNKVDKDSIDRSEKKTNLDDSKSSTESDSKNQESTDDAELKELEEEEKKEAEAARQEMQEATELAKEHLQAAEDMLKKGDYAGLMKLASELEDKKNNGSLALARLIAKDTGVHISFLGGGKGGMSINFDHKGFEPHVSDAIRSWKTVEVDRNGKAIEAYQSAEGGYLGISKKEKLDLSATQAELDALLKKAKR